MNFSICTIFSTSLSLSFLFCRYMLVLSYLPFYVLRLKLFRKNRFTFWLFSSINKGVHFFFAFGLSLFMKSLSPTLSFFIGLWMMIKKVCISGEEKGGSSPFDCFDNIFDEKIFPFWHIINIINSALQKIINLWWSFPWLDGDYSALRDINAT